MASPISLICHFDTHTFIVKITNILSFGPIIVISTDSLARIALDLQLGISHQDRFHRLIQSVRSLLNSDASACCATRASSSRWPSTA